MKKVINPVLRRISRLVFFTMLTYVVNTFQPLVESQACMICVPYPETTLGDRLLENSRIIFARELNNAPYMFSQVEIIRGAGINKPIKVFCDSSSRRKLKSLSDSVVVLAQKDSSENWQMITFADRDVQSFIRELMQGSSRWTPPPKNKRRVAFFAQYLTNNHPVIQEQAYLEVARAPYGAIKDLAKDVPRGQIYKFLRNFQYIEWRSLYILFLGQSAHPDDHSFIRQRVESSVPLSRTTNLAAWLTAFIETNPDTGVAEIEEWYFSLPGRKKEVLEEVMTSLSVLGSQDNFGKPSLLLFRKNVVNSYGTLLKNYPEMAGRVAKELAMWQVRAHIDRLTEIQKSNTLVETSEIYLLDYYLSIAQNYPPMRLGHQN